MGGELVWCHVGQAGIQIGDEMWNLFAEDHDIDCPGEVPAPAAYYILKEERAVPRNILVDTDPATIPDTLRRKRGNFRVFSRRHFVSGSESTGGLYPRGVRSPEATRAGGKSRLLLEEADSPKGFVFFYGAGGGTGSGVTSTLSTTFQEQLPKMAQVHFVVSPNPALMVQSTSPLEAYNMALMVNDMKESSACVILADNDALYNVANEKMKYTSPSYDWVNHLLSHAIGTVSAGWRFQSNPSVRFEDLPTNLVPFPSAKFAVMSFAPMFKPDSYPQEMFLTGDLTRELFEPRSYLVRCNPRSGAFSAAITYRGPTVSSVEVSQTLSQQIDRRGVRFVSWMNPSFKIGITPRKPPKINKTAIPKCACMVTNTTAIRPTWDQIHYQLNSMLKKKAFVHWYERAGSSFTDLVDSLHTVRDVIDVYSTR